LHFVGSYYVVISQCTVQKTQSSSGILDCVTGENVPEFTKVFSSVLDHFDLTDEGTTTFRNELLRRSQQPSAT